MKNFDTCTPNCCYVCTNAKNCTNVIKTIPQIQYCQQKLSNVASHKVCKIITVTAEPQLRRRLFELGFVEGAIVEILNISPMSRAYLLNVQNSLLCIRRSVLEHILVYVF